MQITSNNKATIHAQLRAAMLACCDIDIQTIFQKHSYTLEPLLMQLIRELQIANSDKPDTAKMLLQAQFHNALTADGV